MRQASKRGLFTFVALATVVLVIATVGTATAQGSDSTRFKIGDNQVAYGGQTLAVNASPLPSCPSKVTFTAFDTSHGQQGHPMAASEIGTFVQRNSVGETSLGQNPCRATVDTGTLGPGSYVKWIKFPDRDWRPIGGLRLVDGATGGSSPSAAIAPVNRGTYLTPPTGLVGGPGSQIPLTWIVSNTGNRTTPIIVEFSTDSALTRLETATTGTSSQGGKKVLYQDVRPGQSRYVSVLVQLPEKEKMTFSGPTGGETTVVPEISNYSVAATLKTASGTITTSNQTVTAAGNASVCTAIAGKDGMIGDVELLGPLEAWTNDNPVPGVGVQLPDDIMLGVIEAWRAQRPCRSVPQIGTLNASGNVSFPSDAYTPGGGNTSFPSEIYTPGDGNTSFPSDAYMPGTDWESSGGDVMVDEHGPQR